MLTTRKANPKRPDIKTSSARWSALSHLDAVINVLNTPTRVDLETPQGKVSTSVFARGILRFYPDPGGSLLEVRAARLRVPITVEAQTDSLGATLNGEPLQVEKVEEGRWRVLGPTRP